MFEPEKRTIERVYTPSMRDPVESEYHVCETSLGKVKREECVLVVGK